MKSISTAAIMVISILATVAMAVSGWFANNEQALAARVDALGTQEAATAQSTTDIDERLTRIEGELDTISTSLKH